jgi:hypothetical protein
MSLVATNRDNGETCLPAEAGMGEQFRWRGRVGKRRVHGRL